MRLEIESTLAHPHIAEPTSSENHGVDLVEAKSVLSQGINAAQAGNRAQARASLLRATELDPKNESAWLWLASISEYPEELLGFLNHVLEINSENQRAIEWKAATHALLSKTFVQRGIDAAQENQKDFAAECFQTALEYNDQNAAAWMWMASLSNSNSVKVNMLERALAVDPENEQAVSALAAAKNSILKQRLTEAKGAAVSGNNGEAIKILDTLLTTNPDSVDAWTMKSHLSEGFDEKIRCFESILTIDPENVAAKSGRDSLLAIFGTAEAANAGPYVEHELLAPADEPISDKSPTEDLVDVTPEFSNETHDDSHHVPTEDEPQVEQQYEYEAMQREAEPFGSLAEEVTEPSETEHEPGCLTVAAETCDLSPTLHEDSSDGLADPQAETLAFSHDHPPVDASHDDDEGFSSNPVIPMPDGGLPELAAENDVEAEVVPDTGELLSANPESVDCPFCGHANEPQNYSCSSCRAVLTLSDLELLLANHDADKSVLRQAVEGMERRRSAHSLTSSELITLGLGHLNLRNLKLGYSCLLDASKLDANNIVLTGQVNELLIRLEEIRQQEEVHLKMPKGKSILVVDDSPTVRKLIAGKLEKCGHDVICANDGVEAMERLEHFIPDLVLLDITMPRMDGYQVCKTIRSNNSTKDVPVVMISGKDGFFDKVRGRMAGTTGYITKPFGPETLMKAVEMYLSGEIPESDEV